MSIGWIMFWKAVVMALWVAAVEGWQAYRRRRIAQGLPLKRNRKGVYVVSDWTAKVDTFADRSRTLFFYVAYLYWAVLLLIWAVWGKEGLRAFFDWLLF